MALGGWSKGSTCLLTQTASCVQGAGVDLQNAHCTQILLPYQAWRVKLHQYSLWMGSGSPFGGTLQENCCWDSHCARLEDASTKEVILQALAVRGEWGRLKDTYLPLYLCLQIYIQSKAVITKISGVYYSLMCPYIFSASSRFEIALSSNALPLERHFLPLPYTY